ncbi:intracellular protease YhbO [Chryseobacterium sp. StRB126]|nr:intracellular protease YhbO [Chryseobacterium sp. StRB126]
MTLDQAQASDYDALVLPGGVINPDQLQTNDQSISFVKDFFKYQQYLFHNKKHL